MVLGAARAAAPAVLDLRGADDDLILGAVQGVGAAAERSRRRPAEEKFGLGPSRVGPQTSRPLGASFLISEYALKYRAKSEAVLCNFEPRLFDA